MKSERVRDKEMSMLRYTLGSRQFGSWRRLPDASPIPCAPLVDSASASHGPAVACAVALKSADQEIGGEGFAGPTIPASDATYVRVSAPLLYKPLPRTSSLVYVAPPIVKSASAVVATEPKALGKDVRYVVNNRSPYFLLRIIIVVPESHWKPTIEQRNHSSLRVLFYICKSRVSLVDHFIFISGISQVFLQLRRDRWIYWRLEISVGRAGRRHG